MIRFANVTKEFYPEIFGIADISFDIEPGEFVLLTGPSGSGKTTIMKLLTREYTPSEGEIFYQGSPIHTVSAAKIHLHRRKIGVVFQNYLLIPELNVWENIALPLSIIGKKQSEIEARVTDLLELVSLEHRAQHFPSELSGGEAQRVSIARALATGPEMLFADEPTGNLDASTSLSIAELLKQINSFGTTIVFATHDPVVMKAHTNDRHIMLDKGQLIKDTAAQKKEVSPSSAATVDVEELASEEAKEDQHKAEEGTTQQDQSLSKPESKNNNQSHSTTEKKSESKKSAFSFFSFFSKKTKPRVITLTEDLEEEASTEEIDPDSDSQESAPELTNKTSKSDVAKEKEPPATTQEKTSTTAKATTSTKKKTKKRKKNTTKSKKSSDKS